MSSKAPFIDGHDVLPSAIYDITQRCGQTIHINTSLASKSKQLIEMCGRDIQSDLQRFKYGRVGAVFLSIFTPCSNSNDNVLSLFDIVTQITEASSSVALVTTHSQLWGAYRRGKIAALIGLEGGHMIKDSLANLRQFYRLGARYMTLTHDCHTSWAVSCCDPNPYSDSLEYGLNAFGRSVVSEMNRLGMIIDISHTAEETMKEVIQISKAPVIFSHSNPRAKCNHIRNVPDNVLELLKEKDGLIMVTYAPHLVSEEERIAHQEINSQNNNSLITNQKIREWQSSHDSERSSLRHVVEMIKYLKTLFGGTTNIGIGSDFNATPFTSKGLEDASKHVKLITALIKDGFSDEEVLQISSLNFLRVFHEVEKIANLETSVNH
ncbi:hypothetical protein AKO1_005664 [Acrasis kona]|uniref:Dipeptidase n=1 Tax=Acrasis kona TaxID=1008807 RepID=A0AAW2YHT8_9EUKA